jgi:hypothetical protein
MDNLLSISLGLYYVVTGREESRGCSSRPSLAVGFTPININTLSHHPTIVYLNLSGHSDDWASPKDQKAWFADVSGAIVS